LLNQQLTGSEWTRMSGLSETKEGSYAVDNVYPPSYDVYDIVS